MLLARPLVVGLELAQVIVVAAPLNKSLTNQSTTLVKQAGLAEPAAPPMPAVNSTEAFEKAGPMALRSAG